MARTATITGGRNATDAVIPGDICISVGRPKIPAPSDWAWHLLSDLARLETGHTPSRRCPEYWGGDVPWIGIRDATGNHGRVIHKTNEYTNLLGITNSSARILPERTVCLSRTASVGYVVVMGAPMSTSQDFVNWVCGEELNPHFLKYALLSETRALRMFAVGSVHPTIYFPEVKAFHLCAPVRKEQDAIVAVLGSLDDKIDLNRRMNETLEAMARAIFKDWFVDFGPTQAKIEGRVAYLAPEIWTLFPDKVDDEEKPKGWVTGSLAKIATLNPESWTRATYPRQIEYVDLSNTKWGTIESTEALSRETAPSRAQRVLRIGDTIVGTVRPGNGSYAYVGRDGLTGSTGFAVLRPQRVEFREICYLASTSSETIERLSHLADGGAYPAVRPEVVLATEIPGFTDAVIDVFSRISRPLISRIEANKRESLTLTQTRDLLLPKLMSGEIRIRDAEKIVEAAA